MDSSIHEGTTASGNLGLGPVDDSNDTPSSENSPNDAPGPSHAEVTVSESPYDQKQEEKLLLSIVPEHIFTENKGFSDIGLGLPEPGGRLVDTRQLAHCLRILQSPNDKLDPSAYDWKTTIKENEQERLEAMVVGVFRAFKRDQFKDTRVAEVLSLATVLKGEAYQDLLGELFNMIEKSSILDVAQLEGLNQLIQSAAPGYLNADDLFRILGLLSDRLRDTHQESSDKMLQLTLAVSVSHILDAMADLDIKDLDREKFHEPLSSYIGELKGGSDPFLVYQAAYAYQALLCVSDNETIWKSTMRPVGNVMKGAPRLDSAASGFDMDMFMGGLEDIQKGITASEPAETTTTAYDKASAWTQSGQDFMDNLKEGFTFDRKRDWYSALRAADVLIRDGELATFKELVCKAPCRLDPAFQWGVCQRLGEIASNPKCDMDIAESAIAFLAEIYQDDTVWGRQPIAETRLHELESSEDHMKLFLFRACRGEKTSFYPLHIDPPIFASPSLLDQFQDKPDIEEYLRRLKLRTNERGNEIYIPSEAKATLQAADNTRFPLMEKVEEFLNGNKKVFLLLGESGAGKSAFNRQLERHLLNKYVRSIGKIPLFINLPAIDRPEQDMITKQLQKLEFTDIEIRELKASRKFILICDGYDERQQAHNLYASNKLNHPGEWDAQMVISCRSEHLGTNYQELFQPGDLSHQPDSSLFQEVVLMPFTFDQIQDYVAKFMPIHKPPWMENYKRALEQVPSMKELVKNPLLMTISLEVFPRIVKSGQDLSAIHISRVRLYDHFIDQWLERGRERLEKGLGPQERETFEGLKEEGFTRLALDFLKKLSVAMYREQGGHPIVNHSSYTDKDTWKTDFFGSELKKRHLLEACPLTRNDDQYQFNHRSLLEYGLALAVFDPQLNGSVNSSVSPSTRRTIGSSSWRFKVATGSDKASTAIEPFVVVTSPLITRSLVKEASVVHFLSERVQQEPAFKEQLLSYIEHSKKDKKWCIAASNSITILIKAGVQFIGTDLQGIQIPGADISFGVFDSAQLRGADLRDANLRNVWFHLVDLSDAQMEGVQFGDFPFFTEDSRERSRAYSSDGKSFAVGFDNGNLEVYTAPKGQQAWARSGYDSVIRCVAYSPASDRIASACGGKTVQLWDSETGSLLHTLNGHNDWVYCVAYSPQGDQVASGCHYGTVWLWDATTGERRHTCFGHDSAVLSVTYSPNGQQVASASEDYTARVWDVRTGSCMQVLEGHTNWVRSVAYSPQGHQLATAGDDMTIRLWDPKTGVCHSRLTGHGDVIASVLYSSEHDLLVSGSCNMVRLWNPTTGQCQAVIQNLPGAISSIAWDLSSGTKLIIGFEDGSLLNWQIIGEEDQCRVRLCWSSLTVTGATIQGVRGLTPLKGKLLKQRGAIGEPVHLFRDAGKKISSMVSVVSELQRSSGEPVLNVASVLKPAKEQAIRTVGVVGTPL
ncbi:hypothetical protein BGX34_006953 [Mortierella sp. NVP85]|nr:hypothetical protein BGX34_006953 [Mortierella sp. NVP85]